jgi:hypothetical protein
MPRHGTLTIPHLEGGPRQICNFEARRMPGRPNYWQGRFDLQREGEGNALTAWQDDRDQRAQGVDPVTINWTDDRGASYEYGVAMLRFNGRNGFAFDGAMRKEV